MVESATTAPAGKLRDRPDGARRRARAIPPLALPRQLARDELLTHIDQLPSREGKRFPRSDLADNLGRLYDALWRHAHARGTSRYRLTWDQMRSAAGYEEKTYKFVTPLRRYCDLLEEAGLARISGRDELADGRTCVVTLLDPPALESADRRRSSAGQATLCRAVRRRETRSERANWRERPYCPKGGRGRAIERWQFFVAPYVCTQGVVFLKEKQHQLKPCVGVREGPPGGGLSDANGPPGSVDGGAGNPGPAVDDAAAIAACALTPSLDRGRQFEALRTATAREGLSRLIAAGEDGGDPVVVAIVGWELLIAPQLKRCGEDPSPRLSHRRRRQLLNSCLVIDRLHDQRGYALRHLLELMQVRAEQLELFWDPERAGEVPHSIGFFIAELRRSKSEWRQHWRSRRARRARGAPRSSRGGPGG